MSTGKVDNDVLKKNIRLLDKISYGEEIVVEDLVDWTSQIDCVVGGGGSDYKNLASQVTGALQRDEQSGM